MKNFKFASLGDAPMVARLVDALLVELTGTPSRYEDRLASAQNLLANGGSGNAILAFDEGQPIGCLILLEVETVYAAGKIGVVTELYVDPNFRSRGTAGQLIETACSFGREKSWPVIEVTLPPQPAWKRTLAFYARNNFVEIGPRMKRAL